MMTSIPTRRILPLLMVLALSACQDKNDNNVSGLPSFDEENKRLLLPPRRKSPCLNPVV